MAIEEEHFESILTNIQNILSFLPLINYITLKHIIYHLHLVTQFSHINMMDSNNLAMVFGPALFNLDLMQLMDAKNYAIKSVAFLIDNYDKVFIRKEKSSDGSYLEPIEYQHPISKCPDHLLQKSSSLSE